MGTILYDFLFFLDKDCYNSNAKSSASGLYLFIANETFSSIKEYKLSQLQWRQSSWRWFIYTRAEIIDLINHDELITELIIK